MEKQQIAVISSLIGACQLALVTMAEHLAKLNLLDKNDLANHFDDKAAALETGMKDRALVEVTLRQIAAGLRSQPVENPNAISDLLH